MIQINRISLSQNGYKVLGTRDDGIEVEFETTDNKTLKDIIALVDSAKTDDEIKEEENKLKEAEAMAEVKNELEKQIKEKDERINALEKQVTELLLMFTNEEEETETSAATETHA